jgi:hypothetical protein
MSPRQFDRQSNYSAIYSKLTQASRTLLTV